MSLKNRKPSERQVKLSDGDMIAVRGLSLTHVSEIILAHREDALKIFGIMMDPNSKPTVEQMASVAESMLFTFPNLAAQAIASGTGDSSAFQEALDLPALDQVVLLKEIGELTFKTNGGMGNVLEMVVKMLQGLNQSSLASYGQAPTQV